MLHDGNMYYVYVHKYCSIFYNLDNLDSRISHKNKGRQEKIVSYGYKKIDGKYYFFEV